MSITYVRTTSHMSSFIVSLTTVTKQKLKKNVAW